MDVGFWSTSIWITYGRPNVKGGWVIYESRSDTVEVFATHWMPLPSPPTKAKGDERWPQRMWDMVCGKGKVFRTYSQKRAAEWRADGHDVTEWEEVLP
jgi:hypothetical protein